MLSAFRENLKKQAATILQPDLCHAGGIAEARLIVGMAEACFAAIAPPGLRKNAKEPHN